MLTSTAIMLSLLAGTPGAETRENPIADQARARELVKQLGDVKFRIRDAAEKELIQLGMASLNALKDGEKSPDLHVQDRCRALQPTIRALTLKNRIDAFLAKMDGPLPGDLPFVTNFIKLTGDSKVSRQLYADVLQLNSALLDAAERDKAKGTDQFAAFCQEIATRMQYVPGIDYQARQKSILLPDVAIYLLLSRELPDRNNRIVNYGYTFLNAPILTETLAKETGTAPAFKKLFLAWLEKEPQSHMVHRGLQVAVEAKMKEALPLVLKHVREKSIPIYTRAQTALLLARIGTKEHLPDIEPLLADKTVVGSFGINNVQGQVQLRDIALAVSIKLTGQKMSEYDFDVMKGNEELIHMSYIYCAFSSDAKRDAAHKKYKDFREKEAKK